MISPEALEKARDAIEENIVMGDIDDDTAVITTGGMMGSIAAALQAERDAAAPKLPDDLAGLVEQLEKRVLALRCVLKQTATTKYDADLSERAAATIQSLVARNAELEAGLEDLLSWFPDKPSEPEWRIKAGNYGADDAVSAARALLNKEHQP